MTVETSTALWMVRRPPGPAVTLSRTTTIGDGADVWRLHHTCNGHGIKPELSDQHRVTFDDAGPTVTPSLDCPDCDLHGHITNGVWTDA